MLKPGLIALVSGESSVNTAYSGPCIAPALPEIGSGRLREVLLDRLLEGQQLLDARPLQHSLEMRAAVPELRQIELELPRSPLTPEEMRIRRREVIEEEIAICQKVIGDLEQLEQVCGRELLYTLFSAGNVADPRRGVDARQERMNAACAPRHQRDSLQLLPGVVGQQSCVGKGARKPGLD